MDRIFKDKVSVITIHHGRKTHLANLISGLKMSTVYPDELIIISINDRFDTSTLSLPFPVRNYKLDLDLSEGLPLSKARNYGAEKVYYNHLIFLDVDCIPSKFFIEKMKSHALLYNGLIMGTPRYLSQRPDSNFDENYLHQHSSHHPHRPKVTFVEQSEVYEMFWSLCFYIHRVQFDIWEGFDENFKGYGAEDTDFALKAKENNCPFYINDAIVYHQPHSFHRPPLNHFKSIVSNSNTFHKKWNRWPMENYLQEFTTLKLIDWKENSDKDIYIRKFPSKTSIKRSLVLDEPYA